MEKTCKKCVFAVVKTFICIFFIIIDREEKALKKKKRKKKEGKIFEM